LHYLEAKNVPFLRNLFYSREVPFVKKFEKMAIEAFDKVIITSSKEKTFLCNALKLPPQQAEKIHVVENGVATPQVSIDYLTTKNAIAFLGSMDYYPNIASAIRLVNEIYLPLKREFPFLRCIIIGGNPTKEVRDLGQIPGVQVTGFVDDLSQAICNADVIVLPMTIASGIQNKLLTALSFGMPTVASSRAIFNNDLMDEENLMIAESTEEFLEKTRKLILNPGLRKRIGERAKVFIQENQSWEKVANQMFSIVGQE
jgi:glycosyltransferase involved in cell wall biosynthesis